MAAPQYLYAIHSIHHILANCPAMLHGINLDQSIMGNTAVDINDLRHASTVTRLLKGFHGES